MSDTAKSPKLKKHPTDVKNRLLLRPRRSFVASARCSPTIVKEVESPTPSSSDIAEPSQKKNKFSSPNDSTKLSANISPSPDWDDSTANDSFNSPLLNSLGSRNRPNRRVASYAVGDSLPSSFFQFVTEKSKFATPDADIEYRSSETLPVDNRLGTKIRVVSAKAFPWMAKSEKPGNYNIRITHQEANIGIDLFQLGHLPCDAPSSLAYLEASAMSFLFPNVAGSHNFPRVESLSKSRITGVPLSQEQKDIIANEWQDCFVSLFESWRRGAQESFYVCAPWFTILFASFEAIVKDDEQASIEDSLSQSSTFNFIEMPFSNRSRAALVTHSNFYVRDVFRKEDIKFELIKKQSLRKSGSTLFSDCSNSQPAIFEEESRENTAPAATPSAFSSSEDDPDENSPTKAYLEHARAKNNGVTPKFARQRSLDSLRKLDEKRPNSIIIKDELSLRRLRDLLVEHRSDQLTCAISGLMAGVPPTLVSKRPFLRASLTPMKKSSQIIRKPNGELEHVLEIEGGPIMPCHVKTMCEFLRSSNMVSDDNCLSLKVLDRNAFNGFNAADASNVEWNEIFLTPAGYKWRSAPDKLCQ